MLLSLMLAGGACSSAAAPGAENVLTQKDKATTVQVEAALRNAAVAEETYFAGAQGYTGQLSDLELVGFNPSSGVELRIARADALNFCIDSSSAGPPMHVGTPDLTPRLGACA